MTSDVELSQQDSDALMILPVMPLRDVVVYPNMVMPLFVGREKSIRALEAAMMGNKQIFLVAQHQSAHDEPLSDDLYRVGTVSNLLQLLKLPDGTVKVLVEGVHRASVVRYIDEESRIDATIKTVTEVVPADKKQEIDIMMRTVISQFEQYIKLNKKIPPEV